MQYAEDTGGDTDEFPRPRRAARRAGTVLLALGLAVVLIGCAVIVNLAKGVDRDEPSQAAATSAAVTPSPTESPSASPSPPPPPPPTEEETTEEAPPPPPKTTKPGCEPTYKGKQLAKSQVRTYLNTASKTKYWGTRAPAAEQAIRVPIRLLYAIADQESGWQSNIYACDKGVGVMQVMPDTETWMNQRFGTTYNIDVPADNVHLGAQYLAWLFSYYGAQLKAYKSDGTYNLADPTLLNGVIAAYNWGTAGVDPAKGKAGIPNGQYVDNVKALMQSCCADY
ncbi:lytic transglycosylase domain-containing protein [Dactylosporangium sp. AC04546]|uniref:lytic transglycosylase domain-containing protein n=1 Tax=Dactylosporangium sp. AC04546 TaxID=2862460 RepID=UPI002E7BADD5|nr:lytic transglycosylase domain-containing protein [Dactylosporangium sp. AC04546]WVK81761.1 lytic transglycosylase domain-containing protein [Dactylosporangium sp. AC04546]